MNLSTKQKETRRHREQTCGGQGECGKERDGWESGAGGCKLLPRERINNKVLPNSTENYTQSPEINHDGKEEQKRMHAYDSVT